VLCYTRLAVDALVLPPLTTTTTTTTITTMTTTTNTEAAKTKRVGTLCFNIMYVYIVYQK